MIKNVHILAELTVCGTDGLWNTLLIGLIGFFFGGGERRKAAEVVGMIHVFGYVIFD